MDTWIFALMWGAVAGSALLLGAWVGYRIPLQQRVIAAVMAFGAGVLITTLSLELMEKAHATGGLVATGSGFLAGAALYTGLNLCLAKYGARHRKRSGAQQQDNDGNSTAIAVGALIDGVPESIIIGLSMLEGASVSILTVAAIFISNIPEGLSSAAGMKKAGKTAWSVFSIWGLIAAACAFASLAGFACFQNASPATIAIIMAVAAGAILCMIVDTMIPEAFETTHDYAGIITVLGFFTAFALSKTG